MRAFFYIQVTRKKAAEMTFVRKIRAFNVHEIDTWLCMEEAGDDEAGLIVDCFMTPLGCCNSASLLCSAS